MTVSFNYKWFFSVLLSLAIQVMFLRDMAIANVAFCFIYTWFLVKAPMKVNPLIFLLLTMLPRFCEIWLVADSGLFYLY